MRLRNTEQRQIVYNAVISRCDHPTAEQIYFDVRKKYPSISKSTVYRNLDILSKENKIMRIKMTSGDRFDLTISDHSHVYCMCCGKVVDTQYGIINDKKVEKETCFKIKKHNLVFEGICPQCKEKFKENL